jgi:hypothetical protein
MKNCIEGQRICMALRKGFIATTAKTNMAMAVWERTR